MLAKYVRLVSSSSIGAITDQFEPFAQCELQSCVFVGITFGWARICFGSGGPEPKTKICLIRTARPLLALPQQYPFQVHLESASVEPVINPDRQRKAASGTAWGKEFLARGDRKAGPGRTGPKI